MARESTRRRRKRPADTVTQSPWRRVRNPYKPIEVLSADQVEHIHLASLDVIETLGVDMWCAEALDILQQAGAEVDHAERHVRIDRALIEEAAYFLYTSVPVLPAFMVPQRGDEKPEIWFSERI